MEKKCFSVEEYQSLRNELTERISIMNTQASSAITTMLTIWAAGISLLGIQLSMLPSQKTYEWICFTLVQTVIFLMAELILIPMAMKSGENIRQIVSLGTYIQVFYDYLSRKNNQENLYNWETADKYMNGITGYMEVQAAGIQVKKRINRRDREKEEYQGEAVSPQGKGKLKGRVSKFIGKIRFRNILFNSEYTILGILSLLFLSCVIVISFGIPMAAWQRGILAGVYAGIGSIAIFLIFEINKYSNVKRNIWEVREQYLRTYLVLASEMGLIEKSSLKDAYGELSIRADLDTAEYRQYFR